VGSGFKGSIVPEKIFVFCSDQCPVLCITQLVLPVSLAVSLPIPLPAQPIYTAMLKVSIAAVLL
jgi:hypothetical protein